MTKNLIEITQKVRAWVLWEAGHRTPKSMLRRGKIPIRTAERYIAEFRDGGNWERKAYSSRSQPMQTRKIIRKVIAKATDRKKIHSLRQIGRAANVSPNTAKRILNSNEIHYSSFSKRINLNQERKDTRVDFAEKMLEEDEAIWERMLISDECSIWLNRSKPSKLWTKDAMEEEGADFHGPKVHCWGGITARGALKIEIFQRNLNSKGYLKILKRKVPEMNALYPDGWIFQHDGSGVHRAKIVEDFIGEFDEEPLDWPPYSPDLSPIENIWAWLKHEVSKDMPSSVKALKSSIRKHWKRIDVQFLAPYFASLRQRMEMVIENDGGKINY